MSQNTTASAKSPQSQSTGKKAECVSMTGYAQARTEANGWALRISVKSVNHRFLDVRFRMLQPHELARAQGFPDDYVFTGTKEARTAQIGNAVPVGVAYALGRSALTALGYRVDAGDEDAA